MELAIQMAEGLARRLLLPAERGHLGRPDVTRKLSALYLVEGLKS